MQSTSGFYQHKQRSHLRSSLSSSTRASRIHRAAHETRSGLKQFAMNPRPRTAASAKRLMRRASRSWTASGGSSFLSDPLQKQLSVGRAIDDDAEPSPRQSAGQVPGQSTSRPGLRNTTPSHTKTLLDLHPSPGSSATPSPNPAPATRRKSVVKKKKITSNRRRSTFGLTSRSSAADEDGEFPDPDRKTGSRRSSATSFEEEPSIVDLLDSDEDEDSRSSAPASPAIHANPEGSGKGVDVFYIKTWQQKNPRGVSEVPKTAEFAWRDATLVRASPAMQCNLVPHIGSLLDPMIITSLFGLVDFLGIFCAASSLPGTRREDSFRPLAANYVRFLSTPSCCCIFIAKCSSRLQKTRQHVHFCRLFHLSSTFSFCAANVLVDAIKEG